VSELITVSSSPKIIMPLFLALHYNSRAYVTIIYRPQRVRPSSSRWTKSVVAGGCAGICYWLVAFPFDGRSLHHLCASPPPLPLNRARDSRVSVVKARLMAAPDGARPPMYRPLNPVLQHSVILIFETFKVLWFLGLRSKALCSGATHSSTLDVCV